MKKDQKDTLRRLPAGKLVFSYLVIIMTMSIIFSSVFYITSAHELDKRPVGDLSISQPKDPDHELDEWIGRRSDDGKQNLGMRLITLNIVALVLGGALSYWLARRTLRPIEKALNEQDQFIADASHDLRTPITSALLSNEIALKDHNLTLDKARAVIKGNVSDMNELKQLSDELLREADNGSKTIKLETVDAHAITQEAIQRLEAIAGKRKTTINNETMVFALTTDAMRLRKVLMMLIENAIKYSPMQSVVAVTSRRNRSNFDITVSDEGTGIDAADLKNIFKRFYRADRSRSQTAGYGLGLSIAKKLVLEIGGEISVKSTIGKGSQFTVTLPVSKTSD